jgi:hypothetical protein
MSNLTAANRGHTHIGSHRCSGSRQCGLGDPLRRREFEPGFGEWWNRGRRTGVLAVVGVRNVSL